MRSKFKWIFMLLLAFSVQITFAQEKTITGTVLENGMPLPGVSITVKGKQVVSQSDFDGKYSVRASQGEQLVFTYVGLQTQTVTVGAANTITVTMVASATDIDVIEVVNTGYDRTSTKASTSSAVTTISAKTLENRPNASFLNSLQGTAPGLTILASSGSPGSAKIDTYIRGMSSLNAATEPLIVIDGVPTNGNQFRNLNQNDIETVSVLRDAAATSIYGNRGANGVLVITTKRASFGSSLVVSYSGVTGISTLPDNDYNMANTQQALTLERIRSTGVGNGLTDAEIANFGVNTDWTKQFFNTDITKQHNLSLSFGGENASNYTSISFFEQGGLVPNTDFKRFTLRNNLNGKSSNGKFVYSSQLALGYSRRHQLTQENNSAVDNNTIQNPLHGSLTALPYILPNQFLTGQALYDEIGTNFSGPNDTYVLEDVLRGMNVPNRYDETSILANISASYKITDNFTLTNKAAIDYKSTDRVSARDPRAYLSLAVQLSPARPFQNGGSETQSNIKDFTFTNISSLSYSKTFNEVHRVDAGLYLEYMKAHYRAQLFTRNGLDPKNYVFGSGQGYAPLIPAFNENGVLIPAENVPTASASNVNAGTLSYFASVDYDYKDKFGLSGVVRRDATYRFVADNKWATFWSIAGRWNIDQEAFMEGSTFSLLKLRASYGTQGNQNIFSPAYGTNPLFVQPSTVRDLYATGAGYNNEAGIAVGNVGNPTLLWEEISQLNIGLDFKIMNNKLEGNLDLYRKQTDQLYNTVSRSAGTSFFGQQGNNGSLRNSGVELMLRYNVISNDDLKFSVFANASYNKNEIISVNNDDQSGNDNVNYVGGPGYQWNLIPYIGVNQSTGNLMFLDANGEVTEAPTDADRRPNGKSALPVYQGGFGFNADFKGFFVDALFTWTQDAWRYDNQLRWAYDPSVIGDDNVSADLLNAWTAANPTNFPSLTASNVPLDVSSDRYLYDSSFLRMKNVSVGYNFPKEFLDKTFLTSVRLYVQGENLLTWTKWRGFDPESTQSFQVTGYPTPRTISFGTNIQF